MLYWRILYRSVQSSGSARKLNLPYETQQRKNCTPESFCPIRQQVFSPHRSLDVRERLYYVYQCCILNFLHVYTQSGTKRQAKKLAPKHSFQPDQRLKSLKQDGTETGRYG